MMLLLVITGCVALIGYLVAWCRAEDREQARYAASCRAADLAYLAAGGDPTWPPFAKARLSPATEEPA